MYKKINFGKFYFRKNLILKKNLSGKIFQEIFLSGKFLEKFFCSENFSEIFFARDFFSFGTSCWTSSSVLIYCFEISNENMAENKAGPSDDVAVRMGSDDGWVYKMQRQYKKTLKHSNTKVI